MIAHIRPVVLFAAVAASLACASAPASAAVDFSNSTPLTVPSSGKASLYPSPIEVQGLNGRIGDVRVTLRGVTHQYAHGLDILLVSPAGETAIVTSDACASPVANATWSFTSANTSSELPELGTCPVSGTYHPTDHDYSRRDQWPDVDGEPFVASFNQFLGDNPNGTWKLYVYDQFPPASGKINHGWTLSILAAPADAVVPGPGRGSVANPYPITRTVSGADGVITDVDVSLGGIFHQFPDDLDMVLAGPRGQTVVLMSDACGGTPVRAFGVHWDDEASAIMPDVCPTPARYRPTDQMFGEGLPSPAPPPPYEYGLYAFDLTDPNGEWKLYANDDDPSNGGGFFAERFQLHLTTRPKARVAFRDGAVEVVEGAGRTLTLTRSAGPGDRLGTGSVKVTSAPLTATPGTDYSEVSTTVSFAAGQTEAMVPIQALADTRQEEPESFSLTIGEPVNDAAAAAVPTAFVTVRDPAPRVDDQPPPGGGGGGPGIGGGGGGPAPDRAAPTISGIGLTPTRFAARSRRGTTLSYRLSEAAQVTLRVERRTGRRWKSVASVRQSARAGVNRTRIRRRVGRHTLRRGTYRVRVVAVDGAANTATSRPRTFRVVA